MKLLIKQIKENIKEKFISDDANKNQKLLQSKEHLMKFLDVT